MLSIDGTHTKTYHHQIFISFLLCAKYSAIHNLCDISTWQTVLNPIKLVSCMETLWTRVPCIQYWCHSSGWILHAPDDITLFLFVCVCPSNKLVKTQNMFIFVPVASPKLSLAPLLSLVGPIPAHWIRLEKQIFNMSLCKICWILKFWLDIFWGVCVHIKLFESRNF